jgi:hypothetical protein
VNLAPRPPALAEKFTVIHSGAEIDESLAADLLDSVGDWAIAAELGVARVVEVWGPPWKLLLAGCFAIAAAAGGPFCVISLPDVDDLVAGVRARGIARQVPTGEAVGGGRRGASRDLPGLAGPSHLIARIDAERNNRAIKREGEAAHPSGWTPTPMPQRRSFTASWSSTAESTS